MTHSTTNIRSAETETNYLWLRKDIRQIRKFIRTRQNIILDACIQTLKMMRSTFASIHWRTSNAMRAFLCTYVHCAFSSSPKDTTSDGGSESNKQLRTMDRAEKKNYWLVQSSVRALPNRESSISHFIKRVQWWILIKPSADRKMAKEKKKRVAIGRRTANPLNFSCEVV